MYSRICKHNYRITTIVKIGYHDHSPTSPRRYALATGNQATVKHTPCIDATTLMTRPSRKANEVQYTRHMTFEDCYKYSFIPRTIIQWNDIAATGDFNQHKSDLKSHDLTLSGSSYNY